MNTNDLRSIAKQSGNTEVVHLIDKLDLAITSLRAIIKYCSDGNPCEGKCRIYEHDRARKALVELGETISGWKG